MRRSPIPVLLVLVFAACVLQGCGSRSPGRSSPTPPTPAALGCGTAASDPTPVRHVVWIWLENASSDRVLGAPGSEVAAAQPFVNRLADACASFANMSALQHASLGNYIGATTGSAAGIVGGCAPTECPIDRVSIFEQVAASGGTWRSYQQSLPSPCLGRDAGRYAVRHDPVPYLTRIAADCPEGDLPLGKLRSGAFAAALDGPALPEFAFDTPDLCDDGHDCPVSTADAWLARWIPRIVASPAYARGDVALVITWDEGDRSRAPGSTVNDPCPLGGDEPRADCHVATVVVSPDVTPHTVLDERFDHVAVLQLTQSLLGLTPPLGPPRRTVGAVGRRLHLLP